MKLDSQALGMVSEMVKRAREIDKSRGRGHIAGPPEVPTVDRYTIGHGMIGFLFGLASVPWWLTLTVAVGWEIIENPLKRAVPRIFPVGLPDTLANASVDVAAWMAGYGLARALPPGPVPPIWRR
jgi:hypothetical protein